MKDKFFSPLHKIEISPIVRIAEKARQLEADYQNSLHIKCTHNNCEVDSIKCKKCEFNHESDYDYVICSLNEKLEKINDIE